MWSRRTVSAPSFGQHVLAERVDESLLLAADVMEVDLVEAELGELLQHLDVTRGIGRDQHGVAHCLGAHMLGGDVELLDGCEVPAQRRREHVRAPLVVGDLERAVLVRRPGQVDLHGQPLARTAVLPEGRDHALELVGRLVDRHEPVGPLAHPGGCLDAHRRADQRGRLGRQGPQPGAVDHHRPWWFTDLAGEQGADHVDALAQARVALSLGGPALAGDVLVGRLAAAQRHPQAAREHLAQGGSGLSDDRRVVALAGRVDDSERQAAWPRSAAPRKDQAKPDSPWRSLHGEKWSDDIAAAKPASSAWRTALEQLARRDLLVRAVKADSGHATVSTPRDPRLSGDQSQPSPSFSASRSRAR